MTEKQYSPATRAVSDASKEAYWDWGNMCPADANTIAAAALRKAADEVHSMLDIPENMSEPETVTGMRIAYIQYYRLLCIIAKELEDVK